MKTYVGIDLHSTNCYFALMNESGERLFHKRIRNSKEEVMNLISNNSKAKKLIESNDFVL